MCQVWTAQAQAAKEAYDEAIRLDPSLKAVRVSKDGAGGGAAGEFVIPLGRIKKIIDLDKDKGKVNKEAVCVLEKAAVRTTKQGNDRKVHIVLYLLTFVLSCRPSLCSLVLCVPGAFPLVAGYPLSPSRYVSEA